MTPLSRCVVITIGAVVCAAGLKAQQTAPQQPPRFRSTIDVIQVDVAVVDRNKRPVTGLSAADFTLLENGKPQDIVGFAEVHVPLASSSPAAWTRMVPPDVRTNNLRDGRLFAIVMDDATMPPDVQITANARSIGRGIVTRLGPDDLAAVIFVNDSRRSVDFTNDRARLLAAIDGFMPGFAYVNPDPQSDSQHYFASIQTLGSWRHA
jgi:VWFA-related protein